MVVVYSKTQRKANGFSAFLEALKYLVDSILLWRLTSMPYPGDNDFFFLYEVTYSIPV